MPRSPFHVLTSGCGALLASVALAALVWTPFTAVSWLGPRLGTSHGLAHVVVWLVEIPWTVAVATVLLSPMIRSGAQRARLRASARRMRGHNHK